MDADDSSTQTSQSGTVTLIGEEQQGSPHADDTTAVQLAPILDTEDPHTASTFFDLADTLEQSYPDVDSSGTLFSTVRLFVTKADNLLEDIEHSNNASEGINTNVAQANFLLDTVRSTNAILQDDLQSHQLMEKCEGLLTKCENREKKIRTDHVESTKVYKKVQEQLAHGQSFYDDLRKKMDSMDRESVESKARINEFLKNSNALLSKQVLAVNTTLGTVEGKMKEMVSTSTVRAVVRTAMEDDSSLRNKDIIKQQKVSIPEVQRACDLAIAGAIDKITGDPTVSYVPLPWDPPLPRPTTNFRLASH